MLELIFGLFLVFLLLVLVDTFRTPRRNDYSEPKMVSGYEMIETLRRARGRR